MSLLGQKTYKKYDDDDYIGIVATSYGWDIDYTYILAVPK
jgi:hypothetical protein